MENRVFRIPPDARDTTFIDACAAFLTPKMNLSQVMPSGCNLRRVAHPPRNQLAVPDRPSASDFQEEESVVDPADMQICSFDLGPNPLTPQVRIASRRMNGWTITSKDLYLGGSEPRHADYNRILAMPHKPSLLDLMRNDMAMKYHLHHQSAR